MLDWRGIPYKEIITEKAPGESPVEQFGVDDSRTSKLLESPWVTKQNFIYQFLGYAQLVAVGYSPGDGGTGTIGTPKYLSRITPHFHADYLRVTQIPTVPGYSPGGRTLRPWLAYPQRVYFS